MAQVAWESLGERVLVVAVLRYSRAVWAEFVEEPIPRLLCRALVGGVFYFGGSPRRWWLEYPDCWVVQEDRESLKYEFCSPLPELAQCLSTQFGVWTPRGRGLAEAALDDLAWQFWMKHAEAGLSEDNRALRAFLDDTVQRQPHPLEPHRSIGEVLAEEREHLVPPPDELGLFETLVLDEPPWLSPDSRAEPR